MEIYRSIYNLYYGWWKNIDKFIFFLIILLFATGLFFSLVSTSLLVSDKLDTNDYAFFFKHLSFVFFGLLGITNGLANVLGSSTWAEIYGVKYIGSIKALTTALMVFSTAFGTALFGFMIDIGFSIEHIAVVSGAYIFGSIILLYLVKNKLNPNYL